VLKETRAAKPAAHISNHMMPSNMYMSNNPTTSSYKSGISTYMETVTKPIAAPGISNNIFGSSSSASNFPKKIAIPQYSTDESTRDETKSSYNFKTEITSKPIRN
jgi:hypothetical protein